MFLPENIDLAFSEKYTLSIRLLPGGFSFSIHCPTDRNVFYHKETAFGSKTSYADNIKKLIFDYGFFTQQFGETRVSVVSHRYTLVPEEFFHRKQADELFRFNVMDNDSGVILNEAIPKDHCHVVFDVDDEVHSFLSRNLWNPFFSHHIGYLVSFFSMHDSDRDGKRCYANFHDNLLDICCFQGKQLLSANTYKTSERYDALYFITGVWDKLPLDQAKDTLYVTGNTVNRKETVDTLRKLIRRVENVSYPVKTTVSEPEKATVPTDIMIQLCE